MFDWQLAVVCALIAAAIAYVGRATWRTWTGRGGGCGGKCGCATKDEKKVGQPTIIPVEDLTSRLRR